MYRSITWLVAGAASLMLGASAGAAVPAKPPVKPVVTSEPATAVTNSGATLNGSVTPGNGQTTYAFQYGTSADYGLQTTPKTLSGTTAQKVTETIAGLFPGTTFHYRLIATNQAGTVAGQDVTFRTSGTSPTPQALPPVPVTGTASSINQHGASLAATVNPQGQQTTYSFEYGLTALYGSQSAPKTLAAGLATPQAVTAVLSGLQSGVVYHYRVVATSAGGVAVGRDATFTTAGLATARLSASVTPTKTRRLPTRFTISGRLTPPSGVSRAEACKGRVSVQVKSGPNTISTRRTNLRSDCTFVLREKLSAQGRLGRKGKIKFTARFVGNRAVDAARATSVYAKVG